MSLPCPALPISDTLLAFAFWTSTLFLPSDHLSLPNPWIRLPESASPYMTLFLSPDHHNLLIHWVCKPENLWNVSQLLPRQYSKEPKVSFLVPLPILRRLVAFFFEKNIILSSPSVCLQKFLSWLLRVSC
ncbi:hypothetical protein GOODEAATRI_034611 [Goodea atripinnis]|uniref:Uncharacterized protein n=1 Tax=Goodea atripinnis TaxID=208336 RepID=A0ABV0P029_9TELE